jgi:hypothetical protein
VQNGENINQGSSRVVKETWKYFSCFCTCPLSAANGNFRWQKFTVAIADKFVQFSRTWHKQNWQWYHLVTKSNEMHNFSDLLEKVLYMFRTVDLSETCRVLYQINLRNCASRWLLLQEYITMHSPLNVKFEWYVTTPYQWRRPTSNGEQNAVLPRRIHKCWWWVGNPAYYSTKPVFNSGPAAGILSENYTDLTAKF